MDHYRWPKRPSPTQEQQQQNTNQQPTQPTQTLPLPQTSTTSSAPTPAAAPPPPPPPFLSQPLIPSQSFPPSYPRPQFHPLPTPSRDTYSYPTVQPPPPPLHVPLQPNRLPQLSQIHTQLQQQQQQQQQPSRIPHLPHASQLQQPPPSQPQQTQSNQQPTSLAIHPSRRLSSSPLHQQNDPRSQQTTPRSDPSQPIALPSATRLPHITVSTQQQSHSTPPQQQQQVSQPQSNVQKQAVVQKSSPQTTNQQQIQVSQQQSHQPTSNPTSIVQQNNQQQDQSQNQHQTQSQQLPSHSQPPPQQPPQHLSLPHPTRQPPPPPPQTIQQQQQPPQQPAYHQPHEQDPRMAQHTHREIKRSVYDSQPPQYRLSQPQQPSYYHPYSTTHPHQPQISSQHPQMYVSPPMPPPPHEYQQHNVPHDSHDPQIQSHQRLAPNHPMIPQHPQHVPTPHHHQQPQQQPQQMIHHPQQTQPSQQLNQQQQRPQQQTSQQQQPPQQQGPPPPQQQQQRQPPKMITSLQPQPMSLVQMRQTQNQQPHPHMQQQQQQQQQQQIPGADHHHLQKQQMQPVSSQQPIHIPHHQQPQQQQQLPAGPNRLQPIQERRPNTAEIHQPPAAQMHMPPPPPPPTAVMSTMPLQQRPPIPVRQLPQQPPIAKQQPQQHNIPQNQQHMHQPPQMMQVDQNRHHPVQQAQPQHQDAMSRGQSMPPIQNVQMDSSNANAAQSSTTMNQEGGSGGNGPHQQQQQQGGGGFRQLRVEDALAYLEQVKSQFSEVPSVYNNFLDIMKEFKAQTIDTSEVIRRVSSLFQGHRELILGFNTFLPPGYRIELRGDPITGGVTGFSTPGGVFCPLRDVNQPQMMQHSQGEMNIPSNQQRSIPVDSVTSHPSTVQNSQSQRTPMHHAQPNMSHQQPTQQDGVGYDRNGYMKQTMESDERQQMMMNMPHGQPQMNVGGQSAQQNVPISQPPQNDNAAAALAGGFGAPTCAAVATDKPIEFNQAVTYVNKIKSRFSDDEAVYKTFLGILQTYQKEQKNIEEVRQQVSELFKDHDDLLQEFSHFLPEQGPNASRSQMNRKKDSEGGGASRSKNTTQVKQQPTLEPMQQDASSVPSAANKPRDKNAKAGTNKKNVRNGQVNLGPSGGISKQTNSAQRKPINGKDKNARKSNHSVKKGGTDDKSSPAMQATASPTIPGAEASSPELEFFEEIRVLLGEDGKQNYSEFIKCLSLFSAEIICLDELLRLADGLLNHKKPLTEAFRAFFSTNGPNATQSALNILRRKKSSNSASGQVNQSKTQSVQRALDSPGARERLRDISTVVGLDVSRSGGNKSPRMNPLYKNKPLSEIGRDFGTDLPDSNAYKAVPADLGNIQCSGMTTNDRDVLNHLCISKGNTTGRRLIDDDPSRKDESQKPVTTTKSVGEKNIHTNENADLWDHDTKGLNNITIEDQRVELDLLIARAESCIEKLEKLEKGETRSAASLSSVDLKPIELIYKEAAVDMIEALKSNPSVTIPIILGRLRQQLKNWEGSRTNMTKIWKSNQFSIADHEECVPRSWQKSEMISELVRLRKDKEIPDSLNWTWMKKKISGDELHGTIVCEDDNLSIICDILWYAFEWEASNAEEADEGLAFLERVYYVMQRCEQKKMSILADDHLYCYIRLLSEASERIEFLVKEDKVEMCTDDTIQKIKDVLGNFVSVQKYDEHCKKIYKDVKGWENMLGELPLILKRLGESALKMPKRNIAEDLLSQAEKNVQSESNVETSHEDDRMTDVDEGKNGDGSSEDLDNDDQKTKYSKRLRQAIVLTTEHKCQLFEINIHEDMKNEEKNGKGKRYLDLSFRHVPRQIASQFKSLSMNDDEDDEKKEMDKQDSAFTKYVRRAKKRSRDVSNNEDIVRTDGLNVRLNDSNGQLKFTAGTEDFFMRKRFRSGRRKVNK